MILTSMHNGRKPRRYLLILVVVFLGRMKRTRNEWLSDETYRKVEERPSRYRMTLKLDKGNMKQLDTTMKRIERLRNLAEEIKRT